MAAPPTCSTTTAAAADSCRRSGGFKGGKRYVLAALIGILVVVAIASTVSVVLSPAHVFFYITDLSLKRPNTTTGSGTASEYAYYDVQVTFVANNTSHHAKVRYQAINVELWRLHNWRTLLYVGDVGEQWQAPRKSTAYSAKGPLYSYKSSEFANDCEGGLDHYDYGYPMVLIKTVVQFRYGPSRTRMYSIAVSCPSVRIPGPGHHNSTMLNCTA